MKRASLASRCGVAFLLALGACADQRIATVRSFNEATDRGDIAAARAMMAPNARVWYESPTGEGEPWTLGEGGYSAWDEFFHTDKRMLGDYQRDGDAVWALFDETNDYYLLTECTWTRTMLTWFFVSHKNHIRGLLVTEVGTPVSKSAEFKAWAKENDPAEFNACYPDGRLDTSQPQRVKALLLRWRAAAGLTPTDPSISRSEK
jgi:hypothetical protein